METELLTTKQAYEYLCVSRSTFYRVRETEAFKKQVTTVRLLPSSDPMYHLTDLEAFKTED
ncbi:hypothetical protein HR060_11515 [Catenovulum sp. SM1970]|uniref:helix-turn-helix transcriptional regulator n=1 Tax=Marinifaba aquimaris TaxID=2741323 RepID=UPI001572232A|nr:hypothetical protein [Marinifaba aquimaris]NTS77490.1 hypothetical protein [Marinifaba aquimaris]